MNPETAQRMLHATPGWEESIQEARARLRYAPTMPADAEGDWLDRYDEDVHPAAVAAVSDLGLPWELYADYWSACFYADYRPGDYHNIRTSQGQRAYPPSDAFLAVRLEWTAGTNPRLHIDGPPGMVTAATIREAGKRAVKLAETLRDPEPIAAVVSQRRLAPALLTRQAKRDALASEASELYGQPDAHGKRRSIEDTTEELARRHPELAKKSRDASPDDPPDLDGRDVSTVARYIRRGRGVS